jgi:dual specificity tyrosine-phosphorylation-regulated kinase 2/3/4
LSCRNRQRRQFNFKLNSPVNKDFAPKLSKLGIPNFSSAAFASSALRLPDALDADSGVMTAAAALRKCSAMLTDYEQSEILEYKLIYFLGILSNKLQPNSSEPNHGYDDSKNYYKIIPGDHIAYRYEVLSVIGSGSFGQVAKCFDHKHKEEVALKVIRNRRNFHKQGVVEVRVLEKLRESDSKREFNCIHTKGSFVFRQHLVISFELLSINLYEFLKFNRFEGLSLSLARRFVTQILQCLKHLKDMEIIHCDLKPENILLKQAHKSSVKVIDFGSSCFKHERIYTYIQSRFYRAPEIMLGVPYGTPIDMWSLGCIAAELHIGYPLFPGENEQQQLLRIVEVIGVPPEEVLATASRRSQFFNASGEPNVVPDSKGTTRTPMSRSLSRMLNSQDELFLDFVRRCLVWNPTDRLTPEAALRHSWILDTSSSKDQSRSAVSSPKARLNTSRGFVLGSPRH